MEQEPLSVRAQPRRFKNIQRGDSLSKEIEGEPTYVKWNKRITKDKPYDDSVVSKNKTFEVEYIRPDSKDSKTITSHHKTFDSVNIQGSEPISVDAQPRRFKNIQRGDSLSKEIEGESYLGKWNRKIKEDKPYEGMVVSQNKTFNITSIRPDSKDSKTITSHHKTFDPVSVAENQPLSVRAQPRRFKNIQRGDSLSKEIEGEPTYVKWNKNITNTQPVDETVVSKNKTFDVEQINPAEKEGLTITSHHKTFEIEYIRPDSKDSKTITSHHKTFDPVEIQGTQPIDVKATPKPKRFDKIERGDSLSKEIEGEPTYPAVPRNSLSASQKNNYEKCLLYIVQPPDTLPQAVKQAGKEPASTNR